jgi:hypothetical protein
MIGLRDSGIIKPEYRWRFSVGNKWQAVALTGHEWVVGVMWCNLDSFPRLDGRPHAVKPPPIHSKPNRDLDADATEALEAARLMPPGREKTEALKKVGRLRNAADINGLVFAKRGRPPK